MTCIAAGCTRKAGPDSAYCAFCRPGTSSLTELQRAERRAYYWLLHWLLVQTLLIVLCLLAWGKGAYLLVAGYEAWTWVACAVIGFESGAVLFKLAEIETSAALADHRWARLLLALARQEMQDRANEL